MRLERKIRPLSLQPSDCRDESVALQFDFLFQEELIARGFLPKSRRDPVQRDNPIILGDCHVVRGGVKRHFAPLAMGIKVKKCC